MSSTVISVENVTKVYRLGQIGGGTLKEDFARYWAKLRGQTDPSLKIGEEHHARKMGEQFWALQDVSFQVKQGEVVGIIGRNGAGKSTLLKILSQVTTPTSGQIKIRGRIASLLEVGTGFNPEMTGRENVFLNGAILGMTKAEIRKKFDEIVAFSGVEEFIETPVKRYSSGMYVRLAFAVAAHLEPEILIVDEVLAVGDAEFQKKCLGKMQDVAKGGRTVLFVSHNLAAVRQLCSHGVVLAGGKLQFTGVSEDAIDFYLRATQQARGVKFKHEGTGFKDVVIVDDSGKVIDAVAARQTVHVQLQIENATQKQLQAGFTIFNQMDVPLISSAAVDSGIKIEPGMSSFKVRLPTELFSAGQYRIEGSVWDTHKNYHQEDRLCEFEVVPSSNHEATGNAYRGQFVMRDLWKPN